jgi:protein-S-isoprenylcysteine O-methyltransferase Ste14
MLDQFALGIRNAWVFWGLILVARYLLLRIISEEAYHRAAHVPELNSKELRAYKVQSVSLFASMVVSVFIPLRIEQPAFVPGLIIFTIGYSGYIVSMINFSKARNGIAAGGLYTITRHPMYMTFLIMHSGVILTTLSVVYTVCIVLYQGSTHWILVAEERSCVKLNKAYEDYMKSVNRYFGKS